MFFNLFAVFDICRGSVIVFTVFFQHVYYTTVCIIISVVFRQGVNFSFIYSYNDFLRHAVVVSACFIHQNFRSDYKPHLNGFVIYYVIIMRFIHFQRPTHTALVIELQRYFIFNCKYSRFGTRRFSFCFCNGSE